MPSGSQSPSGKKRDPRDERERARVYQARVGFHRGRQQRRVRDNWIAGLVAGVLVAGAIGSQFAVYGIGPAAPVPAPSPSDSPSPSSLIPGPTETPVPEPTPTP